MRKNFLLLIFLLGSISAQSQILITLLLGDKLNSEGLEFGLAGGMNWSNIGKMEAGKSLSTFNLGFYFDIRIKEPWYLYTGIVVKSKMGVDKLSAGDLGFLQTDVYGEEGDYSQVVNYFLLPVLARYKFMKHFYVEAGAQFGLMYKPYVEFNSDVDDKDARVREYNKDMISRLDAGIMGGLGYKIFKKKGISLGIKYYYGFVSVYKDKSGTNNSSLFLTLTIPMGSDKK
jgi:hypothetical protein